MTNPLPTRPPLPRHLLTRQEVLSRLREERGMLGLTKTAEKYDLKVSQVCDVLAGRAALSRRMAEKLSYVMWTLYERKTSE